MEKIDPCKVFSSLDESFKHKTGNTIAGGHHRGDMETLLVCLLAFTWHVMRNRSGDAEPSPMLDEAFCIIAARLAAHIAGKPIESGAFDDAAALLEGEGCEAPDGVLVFLINFMGDYVEYLSSAREATRIRESCESLLKSVGF